MPDSPHHAINADELMAKIHQEVIARRSLDSTNPSPTSFLGNDPVGCFDWSQINANMEVAEHHADAGSRLLPMLRFPRATRWVARLMGRVVLYVSKVVTIPQMHFNRSTLQALRLTGNGIRHLETRLLEREDWSGKKFLEIGKKFDELEERNDWIGKKFDEVDERHRWVTEKFGEMEQTFNRRFAAELYNLEQSVIKYQSFMEALRRDTTMLERRIGTLLDETRKRLPAPFSPEQLKVFSNESNHLLDPFYLSFEDQFRGTRRDIKAKLRIYLAMIKAAGAGTPERPVLDVGCGRGEWLDLLREEQLIGKGVDLNRVLVEENKQHGLNVDEGDVIAYLSSLPSESIGAVTGFHLIEHLPFEALIQLIDETIRVLKPGGLAVFETPNPENILVGACHFYADPTHKNPIPAYVAKFMVEYRGLSRVEIKYLNPFPENFKLHDGELGERFNLFFYGPRDYAVIGYKGTIQ